MELFLLYESCFTACLMFEMPISAMHIWSLAIGGGVWLLLFLLQGFGLWTMAKNRGWDKKGLVFVPFVNYLYISKLAGECQFFSQKIKRMGLFVMSVQIIATLFALSLLVAKSYLFIVEGEPYIDEFFSLYWITTGFSKTVEEYYSIGSSVLYIVQLIYEIMLLILVMGLFRRYAPRNQLVLSLISVFIPMSRFVIIFCLRNKQAIDYDAYIRARREAMAREYQQRYGNGYGTPYGYGGNPYGSPYGNGYNQPNTPPTQPKPEDPFGEFGDSKSGEDPFGEFSGNTTEKPSGGDDQFFA